MTKGKVKAQEDIVIRGARTHNLKNISLTIPRNNMIVFTGLSGSGKSSLAFDTIFAEGQRRYVESLSAYARQFLHTMQKPDVDEITGLSPAISIDQKSHSSNPRSTVATITEINDYLRVLFARIGVPHCLLCGKPIKRLTNEEILAFAFQRADELIANSGKREVMGVELTDAKIGIYAPVVRGRKGEYYQMLYDYLGKGYAKVRVDGETKSLRERITLTKTKVHDIDLLVDEFYASEFKDDERGVRERLSEAVERALEEADGLVKLIVGNEEVLLSAKFACPDDGFSYPEIEPRLFSFNSPAGACASCNGLGTKHLFGEEVCETCNGARLREEALHVRIGDKNIVDITDFSVDDAFEYFALLELTPFEQQVSGVVTKEITTRLTFMRDVGIGYLTLGRRANTLSGGEAQRIRLASQLGSRLVGALYVLDEPTIGLHQRDNDKLVKTLRDLCDIGNTIIVVEHDEDTIFASDYIVDIGPGAGVHGGNVMTCGYLDEVLTDSKQQSLTLDYLRRDKVIEVPEKRRDVEMGKLIVQGASIFTLKNLTAEVPLGRLVCITGVSGSGKSTFLYEVIHKNLEHSFDRHKKSNKPVNASVFSGTEYINRVVMIDQTAIGRTPRSNPATYTGSWTFIRDLFAETKEAKVRGWKSSRFSFNVRGGRCEACEGNGQIAVEMHFLPTVYVLCEVCQGKRFMKETLEVKFRKKTIYDILEMTIEEATIFFNDIPAIHDRLRTLEEVGLGYLKLGQSATTLSGGEAQRVKIAAELYRPHQDRTLYMLDEPTVGLHFDDVRKLIEILQALVKKGNSVLLIEHNLDVIKSADWLIDFGPEGGVGGGRIVAKGTPEDVAANTNSATGHYLAKVLNRGHKTKSKKK
jgi:excinuclease ABC subunit A